jgi:hypothetical protein
MTKALLMFRIFKPGGTTSSLEVHLQAWRLEAVEAVEADGRMYNACCCVRD